MRRTTRQPAVGARCRSGAPTAVRTEAGAVTAETVMVLPLLVAVTLGLVWLLGLAGTHVRVVDAAREVARAAARDDPAAVAVARGRQVAPDGARITVRRAGQDVVVDVVAMVPAPLGLFGFLPPVRVAAQAVAATEQP